VDRAIERRLEALEQRVRPGQHVCLHYADDEPERFLVDGQEVDQAVWADLAPSARYVIRVSYDEKL
jgi:hypothetical protein